MKSLLATLCFSLFILTSFSQSTEKYRKRAQKAIEDNKLDDALENLDKAIAIDMSDPVLWFNRGIVKGWLKQYEEAIVDFDKTIELNPDHKKAFHGRACCKQDITDYEGTLEDFNQALKIDDKYVAALYNRGLLKDLLSKHDEACNDFEAAAKLEYEPAKKKVEVCNEDNPKKVYPILRLTKTSTNSEYGFTSEHPIMVGNGPNGQPANERAYLNLLRDVNGKPIQYVRKSSCCHHDSENSPTGVALLDIYQITYTDEKGKTQTASVYISMYDYEEPQILMGFKTVGQKK